MYDHYDYSHHGRRRVDYKTFVDSENLWLGPDHGFPLDAHVPLDYYWWGPTPLMPLEEEQAECTVSAATDTTTISQCGEIHASAGAFFLAECRCSPVFLVEGIHV